MGVESLGVVVAETVRTLAQEGQTGFLLEWWLRGICGDGTGKEEMGRYKGAF